MFEKLKKSKIYEKGTLMTEMLLLIAVFSIATPIIYNQQLKREVDLRNALRAREMKDIKLALDNFIEKNLQQLIKEDALEGVTYESKDVYSVSLDALRQYGLNGKVAGKKMKIGVNEEGEEEIGTRYLVKVRKESSADSSVANRVDSFQALIVDRDNKDMNVSKALRISRNLGGEGFYINDKGDVLGTSGFWDVKSKIDEEDEEGRAAADKKWGVNITSALGMKSYIGVSPSKYLKRTADSSKLDRTMQAPLSMFNNSIINIGSASANAINAFESVTIGNEAEEGSYVTGVQKLTVGGRGEIQRGGLVINKDLTIHGELNIDEGDVYAKSLLVSNNLNIEGVDPDSYEEDFDVGLTLERAGSNDSVITDIAAKDLLLGYNAEKITLNVHNSSEDAMVTAKGSVTIEMGITDNTQESKKLSVAADTILASKLATRRCYNWDDSASDDPNSYEDSYLSGSCVRYELNLNPEDDEYNDDSYIKDVVLSDLLDKFNYLGIKKIGGKYVTGFANDPGIDRTDRDISKGSASLGKIIFGLLEEVQIKRQMPGPQGEAGVSGTPWFLEQNSDYNTNKYYCVINPDSAACK